MNKFIKATLILVLIISPAHAQIASFSELSRVYLNQQLRQINDRINIIEDYSISGGTWTGGTVTASSVYATDIYTSTVYASAISGGTITGGTITGGSISGADITATTGQIGGWYLGSTTLSDDPTTNDSSILLDSGRGLIRAGDTALSYITIDGKNRFIRTSDYASGPLGSGWHVGTDLAEFNNIRARGKISTSVFEKDTVSSIGGNFLVADSDILDADMTAADASTLTIVGDTTFAVDDILRIKDGTDDEWFLVTDIGSAPTYTVTRDQAGDYGANSNPAWKKGTAVVNYGASGEGLIFMTASEANAPHIDVLTHAGSPWDTTTTRMRLGNVNGFLGASSDLYGVYIGESDKYLKYDPTNGLEIKGIITAEAGSDVGDSNQLLRNGNFEIWTNGTSSAPDGWSLTGAGGSIAREGATKKIGTYAAAVTRVGAQTILYQGITDKGISYWQGRTATLGAWIYSETASTALLQIADGVGSTNSNSHTGGGGWEWITVTRTLDAGASYFQIRCVNANTNSTIYFDGVSLVEGNIASPYSDKNYSEQWIHASDVTKIDGGDIYANTIVLAGLGSAVTDRMFDAANTSDRIQAWVHASDATLIDGGKIYTHSITADSVDTRTLTAENIVTNTLTANEIAGAAIQQIELDTAESEQSISLSYYGDNGSGGDCLRYETDTDISLPAGLYGLHPQVLATWDSTISGDACTNYDSGFWEESYYFSQVNIQGEINNDIADTYTTYARLRLFTQRNGQNLMDEDNAYLYAKFKYITSSNEDKWIYLLVAKDDYDNPPTVLRKGQVYASSYSSDHPSIGNDPNLTHPFGKYDEDLYDVVLVDNSVLDAVSKKVTTRRSPLRIINEDYEVDWNSRPTFQPVTVTELDPIGDRPGTTIKTEYNVPTWAQPVYGKDTVEIKQRTILELPSNIKYRTLKKKIAQQRGGSL